MYISQLRECFSLERINFTDRSEDFWNVTGPIYFSYLRRFEINIILYIFHK